MTQNDFLTGGGEMGALMRAHDWSSSPLGPTRGWPQSLRAVVALMINSRYPMFVAWGPQLAFLYNDGYIPIFGAKHPKTLGLPFRQVWSEIWEDIQPLVERALSGEATFSEDLHLTMERNGYPEDTWYSFSYSPVRDESGRIAGMFCACTETTQKVLADRRTAAERDRQRLMLQQMPGFVALLSGPQHRYEYVNDAYIEVAGARDYIGRTVRECFPDIAGQGFHELLDRVYSTATPFTAASIPVQFDRADGQRVIDLLYHPILDDAGAATGIFVGGYDVTDRVRAEQALRISEERYRTLFESIDAGFCIVEVDLGGESCRVDYRVLEANPAFWRHTGFGHIQGRWLREAEPALEEHWYERYGRVARTGEPIRFEEGSERLGRWFDIHALRIGAPGAYRVAILFNDISPRKRADAELRNLNETLERRVSEALAEREILADIVEGTDALVQVLDMEYRWLALNKAAAREFERLFGRRPGVGVNMLELLADQPRNRDRMKAVWSRALGGEEFTVTDSFGQASHQSRHLEMKFNTLRDREGRLIGAYQFVYDVTERLRDQERLRLAEEALRHAQKLEAIGQLTGGVAHDFNNLLAVVSSGLQLLELVKDEERLRKIRDRMQHALNRGSALTRQLLTFSRRQAMNPQTIDLNVQLLGMQELLNRSLGGAVQVRMLLDPQVWPVQVDAGEFELAVLNLCVNARDAMPAGGEFVIATRNVAAEPTGEFATDFVKLLVTDTGTGMEPSVLSRAFEPFFTTKDVGKGSGLGLAQVYGFAAQSGGRVEIASRVNEGTTVMLLLPRSHKQPEAVHIAPSPAPGVSNPLRGRVLLVEDDQEVAALTVEMLMTLGLEAIHVSSARAALGALADGRQIDVVFSDIMMPGGMSGLELSRQIKRRFPGLPVILTTGLKPSAGSDVDGLTVLLKPYGLGELEAALREV